MLFAPLSEFGEPTGSGVEEDDELDEKIVQLVAGHKGGHFFFLRGRLFAGLFLLGEQFLKGIVFVLVVLADFNLGEIEFLVPCLLGGGGGIERNLLGQSSPQVVQLLCVMGFDFLPGLRKWDCFFLLGQAKACRTEGKEN